MTPISSDKRYNATHTSATRIKLVSAVVVTALLSACSDEPLSPDIKARQSMMQGWSEAMGIMGKMVKAPETFDAQVFREQAAYLADSAEKPWQHFANEHDKGQSTEAVWRDAEQFRIEADYFQQMSSKLNAAAQNASSVSDIQAEFEAVGGSCKSCHSEFKVKTP